MTTPTQQRFSVIRENGKVAVLDSDLRRVASFGDPIIAAESAQRLNDSEDYHITNCLFWRPAEEWPACFKAPTL